jgi:hypothetical protein
VQELKCELNKFDQNGYEEPDAHSIHEPPETSTEEWQKESKWHEQHNVTDKLQYNKPVKVSDNSYYGPCWYEINASPNEARVGSNGRRQEKCYVENYTDVSGAERL